MALIKHFGCVTEESTKAAIADAVVRLVPKNKSIAAPPPTVTDPTGCFQFDQVDDHETWTLIVYHPEGEASSPQDVDLTKGTVQTAPAFYPIIVTSKVVSQTLGAWALGVLLLILVGCMATWLWHAGGPRLGKTVKLLDAAAQLDVLVSDPETALGADAVSDGLALLKRALPDVKAPPKLIVQLNAAVDEIDEMQELQKLETERVNDVLEGLSALDDPELEETWAATVQAARDQFEDTKDPKAVSKAIASEKDVAKVAGYIAELEAEPKDRALFLKKLREVQNTVPVLASVEVSDTSPDHAQFEWMIGSSTVVTVLFWGFVGSTVRLVMVVQRYLRFRRFYWRGIYQHLALLFAVPVLAAGFVKLASLVTIQAESADLQLDFSNPQIMAVGALLLALSPWSLWDRLLGLSAGVTGRREND